MFFSSPTSNITPALVSTAMTRSDSRDSTTSTYSFTSSQAMQTSYSSSSSTYQPSSSTISIPASGWLPSPYRSCMLHSSTSQSSQSSYISDDDLLALDDLTMPPIEYISTPQPKRELTTEEQIAMLREQQDREQDTTLSKLKAQQQAQRLKFLAEQQQRSKTRRVSGASARRGTTTRRS